MKWWLKAHLALYAVTSFLFVTSYAYANEYGLVPYGQDGDYSPDGYGTCELAQLINNVMLFIIGLLSLIAVLVFLYMGFMMVTSRGNSTMIEQAKGLFGNVLIGIAIMFAAHLIVNTVLSILLSSVSGALGWQKLDCSYSFDSGTADFEILLEDDELDAIIQAINVTNPGLLTSTAGACSDGTIAQVWGSSLANAANCIITAESACGATPVSRSDIGADRNPFSYGAMQINMTVHSVQGCGHLGIPNMNCSDAWSGRNYSARVSNQALFESCREALLNNECNMINGVRIYREAGNSWRPWSTATGCGLR